MLDDFDRYAQQQLQSTFGGSPSSLGKMTLNPRFDIIERDKEYHLQGELPGVSPENVEIEFTDAQTIVVRGRSVREHTEGDPSLVDESKRIESTDKGANGAEGRKEKKQKARYWLSERSYGEFSRMFTFPGPVDQDAVKAKFKNGVLDVVVPKAERKGGRRIEIEGE